MKSNATVITYEFQTTEYTKVKARFIESFVQLCKNAEKKIV